MNQRNTIQRTLVLDAVMAMSCHPTADEIYDEVAKKCPSISKGTVYRNLNRLADEGELLRVAVANAPDRFDRTIKPHCHFRCLGCGHVSDFELAHGVEIDERLNPGFVVKDYELVVNGYCRNCTKESGAPSHQSSR